MRNEELEKEMVSICNEIWPHIGDRRKPSILSKQGGSSGCYYKSTHTVFFRWNVWNKMPLAGKRLLAIHELWHASGRNHNGKSMFCHAHDLLSIEVYKRIWGEDEHYREVIESIKKLLPEEGYVRMP